MTFENLATAMTTVQAAGLPWESVQLSVTRSQPILQLHRLAAQNPAWTVIVINECLLINRLVPK
ncbi:MAG: hypothetical protein WBQ37_11070 [Candidatus Competibacter sp.]